MRAVRAAALALTLGLAAIVPPSAAEPPVYETAEPTPTPEVWYPVPENRRFGVAFQLKAPADAYGIRRVARLVDEALPEVRIFRWGDHPRAWPIEVEVTTLEGVGGLTYTYYDPDEPIRILLADDVADWGRPYLAAHELAHALGLYHHMGVGAVGWSRSTRRLSTVELEALADWYGP